LTPAVGLGAPRQRRIGGLGADAQPGAGGQPAVPGQRLGGRGQIPSGAGHSVGASGQGADGGDLRNGFHIGA
jgi:hypothetical protein